MWFRIALTTLDWLVVSFQAATICSSPSFNLSPVDYVLEALYHGDWSTSWLCSRKIDQSETLSSMHHLWARRPGAIWSVRAVGGCFALLTATVASILSSRALYFFSVWTISFTKISSPVILFAKFGRPVIAPSKSRSYQSFFVTDSCEVCLSSRATSSPAPVKSSCNRLRPIGSIWLWLNMFNTYRKLRL